MAEELTAAQLNWRRKLRREMGWEGMAIGGLALHGTLGAGRREEDGELDPLQRIAGGNLGEHVKDGGARRGAHRPAAEEEVGTIDEEWRISGGFEQVTVVRIEGVVVVESKAGNRMIPELVDESDAGVAVGDLEGGSSELVVC